LSTAIISLVLLVLYFSQHCVWCEHFKAFPPDHPQTAAPVRLLTAPPILYAKVAWINSHTCLDQELAADANGAPDPR